MIQTPPKPDMGLGLLTVRELAGYLRIHQGTVYRLLREQKLPAFRVGSDWRRLTPKYWRVSVKRSDHRRGPWPRNRRRHSKHWLPVGASWVEMLTAEKNRRASAPKGFAS